MILLEELELYKKLQPLFKRAMGEPRRFDHLYHIFGEVEVLYDRRVSASHHDVILNTYGCKIAFSEEDFNEQFIRLPHDIDREFPERGLWGMVDWEKWNAEMGKSGKLWMKPIGRGMLDTISFLAPPTLALLKALEQQEEMK